MSHFWVHQPPSYFTHRRVIKRVWFFFCAVTCGAKTRLQDEPRGGSRMVNFKGFSVYIWCTGMCCWLKRIHVQPTFSHFLGGRSCICLYLSSAVHLDRVILDLSLGKWCACDMCILQRFRLREPHRAVHRVALGAMKLPNLNLGHQCRNMFNENVQYLLKHVLVDGCVLNIYININMIEKKSS